MNNSEMAILAFHHLQQAYQQNLISFEPCKTSSNLFLHLDFPTGNQNEPRLTYVIFDPKNPKKIVAQCIVNFSRMISQYDRKWDIGWCVDEEYRNQGYGSKVAELALEAFSNIPNVKEDVLEASVDENNIASLKIAEKLIGSKELVFNEDTNLTVHSFLKVIA